MSLALAQQLAAALVARQQQIAVAESCTGGLLAGLCTELPGASAWFERGVVCYSNLAKQQLLGVAPALITEHGAVSGPVVLALASGLLASAPVAHTVAISGICGPDGGSPDKPVGTVWLGFAGQHYPASSQRYQFSGERSAIRQQAIAAALAGLLQRVLSG